MRKDVMTTDERDNFNPVSFTQRLEEAGFKFDHDSCPIKIAQPWSREEMPDSSVVWTQWESQ